MKRKLNIKQIQNTLVTWYVNNLPKIVFIYVLHVVTSFLVTLPYINIFASDLLPYLLDWIAIVVLFKVQKKIIFWLGVVFFVIAIPFGILHLQVILELFGLLAFVSIVSYLIMSLVLTEKK